MDEYNNKVSHSKAEQVRQLLRTTDHATAEIATIVGCSSRFVRQIKARGRLAHDPRNWPVRLSRVENELRQIREELKVLRRDAGATGQL